MAARGSRPDNIVVVPFALPLERRSALDRAHRGDIVGAFGRVASHDSAPRRSWRGRLVTLLAILGPGLVVMAADNDAGGISVSAQAGEEYGLGLLWLVVLLAPILYVIQEMAARLGAVTGAGHARLIFERFGKRWGYFALADLLLINLLTIVTEFIGVTLALGHFGISRYVAVPFAALALVVITGLGSFRRWEVAMLTLVGASLVVIPLAVLGGVHGAGVEAASGPGPDFGGWPFLVVAIAGATVAPWQLFFQQSNVIDKRITPRWLGYERADIAIGAVLFAIGTVAVYLTTALALSGRPGHAAYADAGRIADGLAGVAGPWAGGLFALALLNGSILGASAVTLATSYAVGDVFGTKHSLHRRWRDAPYFHGSFAVSLVIAACVVLAPRAPLGLVTIGVQALAGVLLPSATLLLLLLGNDRAVLGPWVNPRWLNLIAGGVVGVLLSASSLLTLTLLFPRLDLDLAATAISALFVAGMGVYAWAQLRNPGPAGDESDHDRALWTMPPLESLPPPAPSPARSAGLTLLRVYLIGAAALVVLRILEAIFGA